MSRSRAASVAVLLFIAAAVSTSGPVGAVRGGAPQRRTLSELYEQSVASVPKGYAQVGHRDTGYTLADTDSAGGDVQHETIMFTAEGGVFTKLVESSEHLPRRLSEVVGRTFANDTSASLNPDLACNGCPQTDTRVTVNDTEATPWNSVGLLARQDANDISNGIAQCSGALIGVQRQHVLTAGHCLVDSSSSGDNVDKITFYPGLSGSTLPFGTLTAVKARVLRQYVQERSTTPLALNFDFALITLGSAAPKGTTYLDIAAGTGTETYDLTTAGYPADKSGQDMWAVNCSNVNFDFTNGPSVLGCGDQCSNMVVHDCLSYEGQSGSAIWSTEGNNRTIRAVLTGALQESDGNTYNVGTQLNSFVYNTVVGWYNEDVTDGLTLAPPAPPSNSNSDRITTTLGNTSWWRSHWWWIVLPVGVCLLLGAFFLLLACCRRRRKRGSNVMVGAAYPPPYTGGNIYPNGNGVQYPPQQFSPPQQNNGFPMQAYEQQQQGAARPDSNYARYGPSYYNGAGSSGATAFPTGYPNRP
mmetsp:Transcript_16296/g.48870  ORF Transcript_16296/g.48870 Transcript_16296/m.48870 type:complete len:527 (+) Transcript_16296:514-2094(+)